MNNPDAARLRKLAEESLCGQEASWPEKPEAMSPAATRLTLHELRVHQIELEMQNEELRRAQAELDAVRARYFDLYDLAPVGYCTVSEKGLILEANLTLAALLGVPRGALVKQPLSRFIVKADEDSYYLLCRRLFETGELQACELQLAKSDGTTLWAHLAATASQAPGGMPVCRIALSDITRRMRMQEELKASERRFRSYFELPLHGIAVTSLEKGWLEVNERLCSMLGYARPELMRMTWASMTHPDDLAADVEQFERMLSGQISQYQLEKRFICKDGHVIWAYLAVGCVRNSDGTMSHFVAVLDDITERKQADEALRESESRTRAITDSAQDAILMMDTAGRVSFWNPAAERILGYTCAEAVGQNLHTFIVPQRFRAAHEAAFPVFLATGQGAAVGRTLDLVARHKDGREIDVQLSLSSVRLSEGWHAVGLLRDISEQKQNSAKLIESEKRFDQLAEQSGTFIWEVDPQGLYTYLSPVVEKVLGYRPDELVGRMHFYDLHPESGREVFKVKALAAFLRMDRINNFVNAAQSKDGRAVWFSTTGIPLLNADGSLRGYRGSDTDISDRKLAEDERQMIDKLQSIGTLAGGIAHDFNNILLGLFGNISIAMEDLPNEHPSYAPLADAEKSMSRAVRLTKQLLTFAKGGDPVKESVSLGDMVEEVARFDLTGSSVSLVCHHDDALWPVDADRGQIQQVVSNLVINARQAMPTGGHLHITLENANIPDEAVPGLKPGRYVKVIVRDEGTGIASALLSRIFDPYFTTKSTGHGLGLATVWSIVSKHGGHIGVVSELGKGTAFTFYLPASENAQPAHAEPQAAACPTPARIAKILVMDDEESVSRLVVHMLKPCGYAVATAPNAHQALALYKQAKEAEAPFDAVIIDLTIPGEPGGKELIKDLLALDPHVRAIVSSGYAGDPVMANPAAYGFKGTVAKPYTARTLREAVARILA